MLLKGSQANRNLAIATPLGEDVLLLERINGREEMSRLFDFELDMLSTDDAISPQDIVGKNVTFVVDQLSDSPRYFNGVVSEFCHCGVSDRAAHYKARVVPWLWMLTRTADCRIFQTATVPTIVEKIFNDLGFSDFDMSSLQGDYTEHEYRVQYRETDFQFVSRLLEEEGIFYFFQHENGKHTLVLADMKAAYVDLPEPDVEFRTSTASVTSDYRLTSWQRRFEFRPGKWTHRDYNWKTPDTSLESTESTALDTPTGNELEVYDYPGRYLKTAEGKRLTQIRMEEEEAQHDTVTGSGTYASFSPGSRMKIAVHPNKQEVGKYWVLTSVTHSATADGAYLVGHGDGGEHEYLNNFTCVPDEVVCRAQRLTERPTIAGPQTAVVVGPAGEEIYPDEFGRVKVQFHWDREGGYDENSSCWVRVSQVHAGKGWGGIDLPRIGEEVIVEFLEGDPDRPIITGRVYNAANMPPFSLPAEKTRSGMKTQTHKGQGYNEISLDDTAGKEQIRIHGQHNMDTVVENNETVQIGVNRTENVGNDETITIGNDRTETVVNNETITVGVDRTETVGSNETITIGANRTEQVGASESITIAATKTENIGAVATQNVGAAKSVNVGAAYAISVGGAFNVAVGGALGQEVGGGMLTQVAKDATLKAKTVEIEAEDAITIKVGGAKMTLKKNGDVKIKGNNITVKGSKVGIN